MNTCTGCSLVLRQTIEATLDVADPEPLRALAVHVDIQHTYIGDLTFTLVPPATSGGAPVPLHQRSGGSSRDIRRTFDLNTTPTLAAFAARSAQGRWTLKIADEAREDEGTLISFGLELRFQAVAPRIAAE
jgi:subtilisin-like proprotein convertase family protein